MLKGVSRKRIFYIFINLVIIILLAEITCRIKYYMAHDDIGYLFVPFIGIKTIEQQKNAPPPKSADLVNTESVKDDTVLYSPCRNTILPKTYNSYGWPGPEISAKKPRGTFRIIALGGSTVESQKLADVDTWCYRLGELLNRQSAFSGRIEVINAGMAGSNIVRIHQRLIEKGFSLEPDLIIYYEAGNDMKQLNFWRQTDNTVDNLNKSYWGNYFKILHYRSMLYTYLIEKYSFYTINRNKIGNNRALLAEYLGAMIEDCRKRGIEFVYVKQACDFPLQKNGYDLRVLGDIETMMDSLDAQRNKGDIPEGALDEFWYTHRCVEQRLIVALESEMSLEKGALVIDPLLDFEQARRDSQDLFIDMVHKTCSGDSVLALSIFNGVKDKLSDLYSKNTSQVTADNSPEQF